MLFELIGVFVQNQRDLHLCLLCQKLQVLSGSLGYFNMGSVWQYALVPEASAVTAHQAQLAEGAVSLKTADQKISLGLNCSFKFSDSGTALSFVASYSS